MKLWFRCAQIVSLAAMMGGCGSDSSSAAAAAPSTDAEYNAAVVGGMHDSLVADIQALRKAAVDLQDAAPTPKGRGWDERSDATALAAMRAAWVRARVAYEHIEGALAPLFPEIDFSIDARYDDYLTDLGPEGDAYPFDDEGVTGLHGVERILWAEEIPANIVTFEASLPGYRPAAYPASEREALDFKNELCAKVVSDAADLEDQWKPARIELGSAFRGLVSLMNEQREKVNKASSNEEESRYSQRTMLDIRSNLEGTRKIYALFQPWLRTKSAADSAPDGKTTDASIEATFDQLARLYGETKGDAIPQPPASWSAEDTSAADLKTPFGKLYSGVHDTVDPKAPDSIVHSLNHAAALLGFPEFEERE